MPLARYAVYKGGPQIWIDRIVPGGPAFPRESSWTRDPNAAVVLRRAPAVVFRVRGPLPARRCAT